MNGDYVLGFSSMGQISTLEGDVTKRTKLADGIAGRYGAVEQLTTAKRCRAGARRYKRFTRSSGSRQRSMSDRNTASRDGEGSRIATNRAAAAIAVGSLLVAGAIALLARRNLLEALVARGIAIDALPMYLLVVALVLWLVIWSWSRLMSLLQ